MVTKKSYCYSFSSWEKIIQSTGLKIFDMKRAQCLSDMKGHLLHKNHPLSPLIHYSSNCLFSSLGALLGKKTININSLAQTLPIIIIILLLLYYYTLIYFAALDVLSTFLLESLGKSSMWTFSNVQLKDQMQRQWYISMEEGLRVNNLIWRDTLIT